VWAVEATRSWREGVREELEGRQKVFREVVEKEGDGWTVETGGGYFAYVRLLLPRSSVLPRYLARSDAQSSRSFQPFFTHSAEQVRHPFPSVPSHLVASRLAKHSGVVVLPGTFFSPPFENVDDDRYLRFCAFPSTLS
jgi:aspartate/methionine/tyrosine aminotransferase